MARAREQPGKINAAAANGVSDFLLFGFVKSMGLDIAKVPYRDIMQAPNDLIEGRIQVLSTSIAVVRALSQAGRVKVMAVASRQRSPSLARCSDRDRSRLSGADHGEQRRLVRSARHAA